MSDHVYAVVHLKVTEPAAYGERYAGPVAGQLLAHGVKILAATNEAQVKEGDYPFNTSVILEFPSQAVFESWYGSDDYAPLKGVRAELTEVSLTKMVVLPAFPGLPT